MDWWMIIGSALVIVAILIAVWILLALQANGGDTPEEELDQRLNVVEYEWKRDDHGRE